jgi:hypothetical protein
MTTPITVMAAFEKITRGSCLMRSTVPTQLEAASDGVRYCPIL